MANLLSNTTVGGNAVITTSNIGTYALTSIPATISPTNIYVGNAIYFNAGNNYLNWSGSRINSNVGIQSAVDMVAPIFYDSNDTSYYADFASTSDSAVRVRGGALFGPNPTWGAYLQIGGNGNNSGSYASVVTTNGNLHLDATNGYSTYINHYYGSKINFGSGGAAGGTYIHSNFSAAGYLNLGGGSGDASYRLDITGTGRATGDFRAPIFYDSADNGYYVDPNGLSVLSHIRLNNNWANAGINQGAINIRGQYPSMQFRNTVSDSMWLRHMDGSGTIQHYYASDGVDSSNWSIKHSMFGNGNFSSVGTHTASQFNGSGAGLTGTASSLSVNYATGAGALGGYSLDTMKKYIWSRGENLLTNGTGLMGNNTNFTSFTFDGSQAYFSSGSFRYTGRFNAPNTDELMPVNPEKRYRLDFWARTTNGQGAYYAYLNFFDVDGNTITAVTHMYYANTLTTLAQTLNPGDTVVYLTSAANWENGGTAGVSTHIRSFIFWNYVNSFGYAYPPETYSQNWYGGRWNPGAVNYSNNTITLISPWNGPSIASGTKLSNGSAGGTFKYIALGYTIVPTTWTNYVGIMDGVDYSGTNAGGKFPPGTASARLGFLTDYNASDDTIYLANLFVGVDNDYPIYDRWTGSTRIEKSGAFYGTIFYDSNDSNFYLNPNATSRLSVLNTTGTITTDGYLYTNYNTRIGEIWGYGGVYRSSGEMLFGTEGYAWRWHSGNVQKALLSSDGFFTTAGGMRVGSGDLYLDQNYGRSVVGLYASDRYQGVFAMGDSYKLSADGTSSGNLYGIAWTHTNVGGQSKSGLGHQALFMANGSTQTAIGYGIWTVGLITTTSYGTSANWNTAYGWGNHASAGYITSSGSISGTAGSISGFNNPTTASTANTIAYRDASGDIAAREFVLTAATVHTVTPSSIVGIYPTTNQVVKFGDTAIKTFLGLGSLAYSSATIPTNNNQLTNGAGYITGYTETDTLASVTGRGASTTTALIINADEGLKVIYNGTGGSTWLRGWGFESDRGAVYLRPTANNTQTLLIGYIEGNQNWGSVSVGTVGFTWNGETVATRTWVTSQNYITGISFASVSSKPTTISGYGITDALYQNRDTINVDTFNPTGLYRGSTSGWSNRPTITDNSGALLQIDTHPGNYHTQLFFDSSGTRLYLRSAIAGSWNSWVTMWHSGNLTNLNQLSNGPGYLTSSALSSYVPISGATLTEGNYFYFRTNKGNYLGSLDSATLQVFSTGGNSAFMSFHRGGYYAVNFGLDADNVMRIGGWSAGANRWQLDMDGNNTVAGSFRAPIFYDSDNTAYYGNFAGTSVVNAIRFNNSTNNGTLSSPSDWGVRVTTDAGYINFGPANGSYAHIYTDRDTFYFNRDLLVNGYSVLTSSNYSSWAATATQGSQGATAYSWGNHASAGYQSASTAITTSNIGSQSVSNASTAGGLAVHSSRNNEVNKIVRTDANGYIQAGWINTPSGVFSSAITKIYCSDDDYVRFQTPATFISNLGLITTSNIGSQTVASATTFSTTRTNYKGVTDGAVAGQLMWKNYGNLHTIFDASAGTSPNGGSVSVHTPDYPVNNSNGSNTWGVNPNLMGWNGSNTYGVKVDWSRYSESTGSVAWTNVSSRPTALSQFTNDLGNYGGWITGINSGNVTTALGFTPYNATNPSGYITSSASISGNAATATNVAWSGVTSKPAGWLNEPNLVQDSEPSATAVPSGFYQSYLGAGNPTGTWFNYINVRHSNTANGHGFQLGMSYYDTNLWFRSYQGATSPSFSAWAYAISSLNIGSQSVNYANSAGSASTAGSATSASQLTKYGDIYGDNWNTYFVSSKLIVSAVLGMSGANKPPTSYDYGVALSYGEAGGPLMQMYFPENSGNIGTIFRKGTYRTGWNGNWSTWKTLVEQEGNLCTIVGGNGMGLEVQANVGYNQDPLTYFLLRGQADSSWKALKIRLTGDAGGQDIEFRRIAENSTDSRMFYIPRGANTVNFDYPIVQPSDSRLKDNITPITTPVDKIKSLRGVEFDWNSGEHVGTHDVGLIAQDVEAVLPEAVTTQEDGYKNLAYTKVIPLLVEAMKEQQTMIEALRAEIELLKNK